MFRYADFEACPTLSRDPLGGRSISGIGAAQPMKWTPFPGGIELRHFDGVANVTRRGRKRRWTKVSIIGIGLAPEEIGRNRYRTGKGGQERPTATGGSPVFVPARSYPSGTGSRPATSTGGRSCLSGRTESGIVNRHPQSRRPGVRAGPGNHETPQGPQAARICRDPGLPGSFARPAPSFGAGGKATIHAVPSTSSRCSGVNG